MATFYYLRPCLTSNAASPLPTKKETVVNFQEFCKEAVIVLVI